MIKILQADGYVAQCPNITKICPTVPSNAAALRKVLVCLKYQLGLEL